MIKLTEILNEDCWKGYKQIGGKMKNGKMVPNCVPESVQSVNERYRPNLNSKGYEAAQKVIRQLQSSVFRKLNDDELLEFRKAIADAFNLDGVLKENTVDNHNDSSVPYGSGYDKVNEASMTVSIANVVDELFPKEFFWVYNPQDKERVKSVIGDLVRTLNTFYKKQNIKVRFTDTNFKMKMYTKESAREDLTSSERLELYKLYSKAMKAMPQSPKQKKIIKQINVLRNKAGMKPLREDLRKWFGKGKTGSSSGGGWDRYSSTGKKLGKCGDGEDGDAYAACLSKEKAAKLGPKGRAAFVKRKRADQKKAGDTKKGGNRKKGKTPTFSKTGA